MMVILLGVGVGMMIGDGMGIAPGMMTDEIDGMMTDATENMMTGVTMTGDMMIGATGEGMIDIQAVTEVEILLPRDGPELHSGIQNLGIRAKHMHLDALIDYSIVL